MDKHAKTTRSTGQRTGSLLGTMLGQLMLALALALPLTAAAQPADRTPHDTALPRLDSKYKPPQPAPNSSTIFGPIELCTLAPQLPICQTPFPEVKSFGSNPGNLKMFKYVPDSLGTSRPLVVVLHGCAQSATYADNAGWIQFANKYHFSLLMPEQQLVNNASRCFRWFDSDHNRRGKGEALSIKQMIDKMLGDANLKIDKSRVYITGLSGGGGMATVMLAAYREMFAGGAIIAGIPYGCANTANEATSQCGVSLNHQASTVTMKQLPAGQWGDFVRNADTSCQTGDPQACHPLISIWQGTADTVVNPKDEIELIKQWTNVLGAGQTPQIDETIKGHTQHQVFQNSAGKAVVEAFFVKDMDHGTAVDPGQGSDKCGKAVDFILSEGICSSFYISKFWGIDKP